MFNLFIKTMRTPIPSLKWTAEKSYGNLDEHCGILRE